MTRTHDIKTFSLKLLLCASLATGSSFAANLVTNSDFSDGLNSWVSNTHVGYAWTANSDAHYASTGCVGSDCVNQNRPATENYLYQVLNTQAGGSYNLSFDYASGDGTPSELKVLWDGSVVLDLTNANTYPTQYSVANLTANSGRTQLTFLGRQDPSFLFLTNVDVEPTCAAAPEPASLGLIFGGLGLAGVAKLRSRRKSRA